MIRTTIDPVFSAFGTVRDRAAVGVPMALMPGAPVALYCFARDTHWDYLEGMTLLLVQDGDAQRQFYLDRAITIRAGVIFGFFCLSAGSRILGEADLPAPLQTVQAPILPEERPLQLFTLFHQKAAEGLYFRGEQHPPVELVYLEHGCLHNYCGGRDLVLHPRELLLFDREQWHMQVADEGVQFLTVSFLWEGHDFSPWAGQVISASAEVQQAVKALLAEYHR